jgi:hypothetical protein
MEKQNNTKVLNKRNFVFAKDETDVAIFLSVAKGRL